MANNLNQILLEGNLTRDPEFRTTKTGKLVCNFSVASNRYLRQDDGEYSEDVSYFDITAWASLAESMREISKGRGVRIIGRLKQDRWETDGQKRSRVLIVAEHIVFKPVMNKKDAPAADEEVPF